MSNIARRSLLAGTAAVLASPAIVGSASAAQFSLKLGHNTPVSHPVHIRAIALAERVKAETQGRMEIAVFPSSQLGTENDMLSQVRVGGLEMMVMPALVLSVLVPASSIHGVWTTCTI